MSVTQERGKRDFGVHPMFVPAVRRRRQQSDALLPRECRGHRTFIRPSLQGWYRNEHACASCGVSRLWPLPDLLARRVEDQRGRRHRVQLRDANCRCPRKRYDSVGTEHGKRAINLSGLAQLLSLPPLAVPIHKYPRCGEVDARLGLLHHGDHARTLQEH